MKKLQKFLVRTMAMLMMVVVFMSVSTINAYAASSISVTTSGDTITVSGNLDGIDNPEVLVYHTGANSNQISAPNASWTSYGSQASIVNFGNYKGNFSFSFKVEGYGKINVVAELYSGSTVVTSASGSLQLAAKPAEPTPEVKPPVVDNPQPKPEVKPEQPKPAPKPEEKPKEEKPVVEAPAKPKEDKPVEIKPEGTIPELDPNVQHLNGGNNSSDKVVIEAEVVAPVPQTGGQKPATNNTNTNHSSSNNSNNNSSVTQDVAETEVDNIDLELEVEEIELEEVVLEEILEHNEVKENQDINESGFPLWLIIAIIAILAFVVGRHTRQREDEKVI